MRQMLRFSCALLLAATVAATPGRAEYPEKPIRLISGYPPGATTDYAARVIAQAMGERLGQSVIVESKPGADSEIAVQYVIKSPADGYTLLFANKDATSMAEAEKPALPYRIPDDLSYIARMVQVDFTYVVNPKLPFHTMKDLVDYSRANPGKLRYGSAGVGSAGDVARMLLQKEANITITGVPYRGSAESMIDTISGVIDVSFQSVGTMGDNAHNGKLRLIVAASAQRNPLLPDLPSMVEEGYPHSVMNSWLGIMAPAKVPLPVLEKLRRVALETENDPDVKARFTKLGVQAVPAIGDDFRKLVADEVQQYSALLKEVHFSIGGKN